MKYIFSNTWALDDISKYLIIEVNYDTAAAAEHSHWPWQIWIWTTPVRSFPMLRETLSPATSMLFTVRSMQVDETHWGITISLPLSVRQSCFYQLLAPTFFHLFGTAEILRCITAFKMQTYSVQPADSRHWAWGGIYLWNLCNLFQNT